MLLQIQHITKCFDDRTAALTDVSFSVDQGEFVSVIGPSGAGKTTLLRLLNGAIGCDQGAILYQDEHFEAARGRRKRVMQKKTATIYQDFCLVENVSCLQNVLNACLPDMAALPASLGRFSRTQREEAVRLLTRVGLEDKLDTPVKNLSGGQKQRVAIARALLRRPLVLLADEPVASLDPATGRQILGLLRDIQQTEHLTVLMNSHNLALSREFSDRLIGLREGRMVFDGSVQEATPNVIAAIYGTAIPE
ncbi:MAG: ATP-binding cassette domain-containing protein [Lachnospiraceae bacterium]|nr:ATP-binding cassette domain-containing protein [Lachnospiraceae bacterium]